MDNKSIATSIFRIAFILIGNFAFYAIIIGLTSCENYKCHRHEVSVYCNTIQGTIVKKYIINDSGRPLNSIDVVESDKTIYTIVRINNAWYDYMKINDSLSKPENSFDFTFFRNDSLSQKFKWDLVCNCDSIR